MVCNYRTSSYLFLILFCALLTNQSTTGEKTVIAGNSLSIPFESKSVFHVSSPFGYRSDPLGRGSLLHDGIDLGASCGTNILASADGIVYEVGFQTGGLGNYVYIKHETDQGTIYTGYGHMLDNSIVVEKGDSIIKGQKIGEVGSTGASTGCHLHFMIMKGKISYKFEDLIDPHFVIYGLN